MTAAAGLDTWGAPVAAGDASTVDSWNAAWDDALHFVGDPFATLAPAIEADDEFALGPVFRATYTLLGGAPPDADSVTADVKLALERASSPREIGHVEALQLFAAGNYTAAAQRWDAVNASARDLPAIRFAHDVYLHVGNVEDRLRSSTFAMAQFGGDVGWNFIASQHSFALCEAGRFSEAEEVGWRSLEADPHDTWAIHAIAHVHEHINHPDSVQVLRDRVDTWSAQDGLAVHMWWHLTLRLIADGAHDEVLAIHDEIVPDATTPFRLCDLASMLWRLELVGVDVGDRWDHLASAFADRPEQHTCGFLDLHQALVYARRPEHPHASVFASGVQQAHEHGDAEVDSIFRSIVRPLVDAVRLFDSDPEAASLLFDRLAPMVHNIGGSNAQRELLTLTRATIGASS